MNASKSASKKSPYSMNHPGDTNNNNHHHTNHHNNHHNDHGDHIHLDDDDEDSIRYESAYDDSCCCCCCRLLSRPRDSCMCSCSKWYPNRRPSAKRMSICIILVGQLVMLLALACSISTMTDCQLVYADSDVVDPVLLQILMKSNQTTTRTCTGMGFLFFENLDHSCAFNWHGANITKNMTDEEIGAVHEEKMHQYQELTGSQWGNLRVAAGFAVFVCLVLSIWSLTLTCCAHSQWVRYTWAILCLGLLLPLQASTLAVLGSPFCETADCRPGRTLGFDALALVCYVLAAVLIMSQTRNYFPGMERFDRPATPIVLDHKVDDDADDPDRESQPGRHLFISPASSNGENGRRQRRQPTRRTPEQRLRDFDDGLGDAQEVPISVSLAHALMMTAGVGNETGPLEGGSTHGAAGSVGVVGGGGGIVVRVGEHGQLVAEPSPLPAATPVSAVTTTTAVDVEPPPAAAPATTPTVLSSRYDPERNNDGNAQENA